MRITAQKVRFAAYVLCVSAISFVDASQASLAQAPRALVGVSVLKSPWDGLHVAPSDLPYVCPVMPDLPHDFTTTRYYKDAKSSIIDPVLKMDWGKALDQMAEHIEPFFEILAVANAHQDDVHALMDHLKDFDQKTLTYLAMEVAREYADYHSREALH